MLEIKNINKSYTTGEFTQLALKNISIDFQKNEFVSILGPSGSGKTTCLNIIGGLDQYDDGNLIINGKSTKDFKNKDWDAYRNNCIGFVFQSYNLITHISILKNVEMGMTLTGENPKIRKEKAIELLTKVGLKDHIHKKPNQLSGGQMQRVAIARALTNNPNIVLLDEPTGALDTTTSKQIMELLKEICKDKLVIMVTHNPKLAEEYSDRIIKFKDGEVLEDTRPEKVTSTSKSFNLKYTKMNFLTALSLSGTNIITKKWRTLLTAFASSIGIVGIALILSLSNGFKIQIDKFESDALTEMPIIINSQSANMDIEDLEEIQEDSTWWIDDQNINNSHINLYDIKDKFLIHENNITHEYVDYINELDPKTSDQIAYFRLTALNLLRKVDNEIIPVQLNKTDSQQMMQLLQTYPINRDTNKSTYLKENYELINGEYPKEITDIILVVDNKHRLDASLLKNLGYDVKDKKQIKVEDLIGTEFQIIPNDNYYIKTPQVFMPNNKYNEMYDNNENITIKIAGVVKLKEDIKMGMLNTGFVYSDELLTTIIDQNKDSEIVKAQEESSYNVLSMQELDDTNKKTMLSVLGADTAPFSISLFPTSFDEKEALLNHLDSYNEDLPNVEKIMYNDMAENIVNLSKSIMDTITVVLIAFAAISLVVSLIMIGIITYISVLERTKEIGILRALGARKRDITNVFNAETFIIGLSSGLLGITIAFLLTIPANNIIEGITGMTNVAVLNPLHSLLLVITSLILTVLGGLIPARIAAKKDPVEALRSE